jgi:C-terminal processing protease CtpA/Prc
VVDIGDVPFLRRRTPRNTRAGDLGFVQKQQPPDIEPEDYKIEVSAIRAGGPAAGSGLQVGDVIVSVDGHDVRGVEYWRFQALAGVPEGTTVSFGLARGQTVKIRAGRPE